MFEADGDCQHIHQVLTNLFPVLEGYTLMRLGENSKELVQIDGPDGQAKLFVRPLQQDLSIEEACFSLQTC